MIWGSGKIYERGGREKSVAAGNREGVAQGIFENGARAIDQKKTEEVANGKKGTQGEGAEGGRSLQHGGGKERSDAKNLIIWNSARSD